MADAVRHWFGGSVVRSCVAAVVLMARRSRCEAASSAKQGRPSGAGRIRHATNGALATLQVATQLASLTF